MQTLQEYLLLYLGLLKFLSVKLEVNLEPRKTEKQRCWTQPSQLWHWNFLQPPRISRPSSNLPDLLTEKLEAEMYQHNNPLSHSNPVSKIVSVRQQRFTQGKRIQVSKQNTSKFVAVKDHRSVVGKEIETLVSVSGQSYKK